MFCPDASLTCLSWALRYHENCLRRRCRLQRSRELWQPSNNETRYTQSQSSAVMKYTRMFRCVQSGVLTIFEQAHTRNHVTRGKFRVNTLYRCSRWDFGGVPKIAWRYQRTNNTNIVVRTSLPGYYRSPFQPSCQITSFPHVAHASIGTHAPIHDHNKKQDISHSSVSKIGATYFVSRLL